MPPTRRAEDTEAIPQPPAKKQRIEIPTDEDDSQQLKTASVDSTPNAFTLHCVDGRARRGTVNLFHGKVETPAFMPVGTHGTVKMIPMELMETLGARLFLGNTYHLGHRPGTEVLTAPGSKTLHGFLGKWTGNLLTDSGGFQMVSLLSLSKLTENGVEFKHPKTGDALVLTPEESMRIQNSIGADVMMALDDVVSAVEEDKERVAIAVDRTTRWLDRCIAAHRQPEKQHLWAIVQGGLHRDLRHRSLEQLMARNPPGYAIGGLSGGEAKSDFWQMVELCTAQLPQNKSRYLMGVGYPSDLVVCVALGCDLFDCVYPTRTARFGTVLTDEGVLRLKRGEFKKDTRPIDANCDCDTCKHFTRSYLYHVVGKQPSALALLTAHNLRYLHNLGRRMREAVERGQYKEFAKSYLQSHFKDTPGGAPIWMRDALVHGAGYTDAVEWFPAWKEGDEVAPVEKAEAPNRLELCGTVPHHVPHKSNVHKTNNKKALGDLGAARK